MDAFTVVTFYLLLPLFVSTVFLASYLNYLQKEKLRATGERVRGVITANKFHLSRVSVFRPVVRFTTQAGVVVEAEDTKGTAFAIPRYSVGTLVWVAYEKANPYDFMLLTPGNIM